MKNPSLFSVSSALLAGVLVAAACLMHATAASAAPLKDVTDSALDRCLNSPKTVSTADMSDCYGVAAKAYDGRLNSAYKKLMVSLPQAAAQQLQVSQRSWLAYRQAELLTQSALFETRQGTMYVPMQEEQGVALTRDRVLRLEAYGRVMAIDGQ